MVYIMTKELDLLKEKLGDININRLNHSIQCMERFKSKCGELGVTPTKRMLNTLLLHDIGYSKTIQDEFDVKSHNLAGYLFLDSTMPNDVHTLPILLHGFGKGLNQVNSLPYEDSLILSVLDYFDVTTSHEGKECSIESRIASISSRYGEENRKYLRALSKIEYFKTLERDVDKILLCLDMVHKK